MNTMLTVKSGNRKTGAIPVSTSSRETCPPSCGMYKDCYARFSFLGMHWKKITDGVRGTNWFDFLDKIAALPTGQLWRHNQAGDLPGKGDTINRVQLRQLTNAAKHTHPFTFTHKPVLTGEHAEHNRSAIVEANCNGFTVALSADHINDVDALADLGIAPVVTVLPSVYARKHEGMDQKNKVTYSETIGEFRDRLDTLTRETPAGRKIVVCPATYTEASCASCRICANAQRDYIIGFPVHGMGASNVDKKYT